MMDAYADIEDFTPQELGDWLRNQKGLDDDVIKPILDEGITGRTFLDLNPEDVQDLFPRFLARKIVRDLLKELNDCSEEQITPCKQNNSMVNITPSPRDVIITSKKDEITITVPSSQILSDASSYSASVVNGERKRIVRISMDTLIGKCQGRPSESEIMMLAKQMATQYPVLRDVSTLGLRDNYSSLIGFLRRRMYNITPSTRKRKAKRSLAGESEMQAKIRPTTAAETPAKVKPTAGAETQAKIKPTAGAQTQAKIKPTAGAQTQAKIKPTAGAQTQAEVPSQEIETTVTKPQATGTESNISKPKDSAVVETSETSSNEDTVMDRGSEAIDQALQKCSVGSTVSSVEQMLRITQEFRQNVNEDMPNLNRMQNILKRYPCLKNPMHLIYNMSLQLKEKRISTLYANVLTFADSLLDYITDQGLLGLPRSALKTDDDKILVAMCHLPRVSGAQKKTCTGLGKLKLNNLLIHIVKKDETWQDASQNHKQGQSHFWIMCYRLGTERSLLLMNNETVMMKCSSGAEAVLAVMAAYYTAIMPYPSSMNGALLFLQEEVLEDDIHEGDKSTLKKARKLLDKYKTDCASSAEDLPF